MIARPFDLGQWLVIVKSHINWPFALFLLASAGYVTVVHERVRNRHAYPKGASEIRTLLCLLGLLIAFLYPLMPFSGTYNAPDAALTPARRYLILPFAIGLVILSPKLHGEGRAKAGWVSLFVVGVMTAWSGLAEAAATAAICGMLGFLFWDRLTVVRRHRSVAVVLVIAMLVAAARLPAKERSTASSLYAWGGATRPIGQAWKALELLPSGARIAAFGPAAYQYYPLFGRSFQLVPVALTSSGKPWRPLNEEWREDPVKTAWWADEEAPDAHSLAPNLRASGVQYVLVTKWDGDQWPPQ